VFEAVAAFAGGFGAQADIHVFVGKNLGFLASLFWRSSRWLLPALCTSSYTPGPGCVIGPRAPGSLRRTATSQPAEELPGGWGWGGVGEGGG